MPIALSNEENLTESHTVDDGDLALSPVATEERRQNAGRRPIKKCLSFCEFSAVNVGNLTGGPIGGFLKELQRLS